MRVAPLLLLLSCAGCPAARQECDRNAVSTVELRDGKGELLLAAKPSTKGGTLDACDGNYLRLGTLKQEGVTVTLFDRGGAPRLNVRKMGPDDLEASGPDGDSRFRVHRQEKQLFVLDSVGVRLGSIVDGDKVVFFDRTQTPTGSIEPRGRDQAVRDPDGVTQYLVQPAASSQAAGLFTVGGLDRTEQLSLYLLLQR